MKALIVVLLLILSCNLQKYQYTIVGNDESGTKCTWHVDSYYIKDSILYVPLSNGYTHKIYNPKITDERTIHSR